MSTNTLAEDYVMTLQRILRPSVPDLQTRSKALVKSLQLLNPKIQTKGFKLAVPSAIFEDGVNYDYPSADYSVKLGQRLERRFGKRLTRQLLCKHCEILHDWVNRDCRFVPDAYLIDADKRTIVCYEIEDTHPLTRHSILKYGDA